MPSPSPSSDPSDPSDPSARAAARQAVRRARAPEVDTSPRLRAAPGFVLMRSFDDRPYVLQDSEPYAQYWLSAREHRLLALFGERGGCSMEAALQASFRWTGAEPTDAERRRLLKDIRGMLAAGVLLTSDADSSRYDARIAHDYIAHRPYPQPVAQQIIARGALRADSRVLDLAGGPGDLALALARVSNQVTMMELSRGFVATAARRARALGLRLHAVQDSCNRLAQHDAPYDVVTVSQALHWLDDVQVCRGVLRLLQPDGSFFVVHAAMELPDAHPLAYLLGHDSVLGRKPRQAFSAEVQPLLQRLAALFDVLDAPAVQRIDPAQRWQADGAAAQRIGVDSVTLFRQTRPFDAGYARGFLTPTHIAALTGGDARRSQAFWQDLARRCAAVPPEQRLGRMHWALLHLRRGAGPLAALPDWTALPPQEIGYEASADADAEAASPKA